MIHIDLLKGYKQEQRIAQGSKRIKFAKYAGVLFVSLAIATSGFIVGARFSTRASKQNFENLETEFKKLDKKFREDSANYTRLQIKFQDQDKKFLAVSQSVDELNDILGSDYLSEDDKREINKTLQQIFNRPINEISGTISTYDSIFTLFDWFYKNIEYQQGSRTKRLRMSPAKVLTKRLGDCDEQAISFDSMVHAILKVPTRLIRIEKHIYAQVFVGKRSESKNVVAELTKIIHERYNIPKNKARSIVINGLDYDDYGVWFTVDTTASTPGQRIDDKIQSIVYHW